MKIITVCGLGMGSSLILKMTVEKVTKAIGLDCDVQHWDMGTIKGVEHDLIISSKDLQDSFPSSITKVVFVNNIIDENEILEKLTLFLKK